LNRRRQPFQWGEIGGSIHATSELLPQESNNFPRFVAVFAIPHRQSVPELCLQVLLGNFRMEAQKGKSMQNGSMMRTALQSVGEARAA